MPVSESNIFFPPRRAGAIFQISAIAVLLLVTSWGLWMATLAQVGPVFLLYLTPALISVPLIPLIIYRLYTLKNSSYTIERDSIRLQWGWRVERIPADDILWVRPASDLEIPLHLPRFRWPGAILGFSHLPDSRPVEFLASMSRQLILIGTVERAYAISPRNTQLFIQHYQRLIELGSLNLASSESVYPSFLFSLAWQSRLARALFIIGALFSVTLLAAAILAVPQHPQISMGLTISGAPRDPLPGVQILFLPVFSNFIYIVNGIVGLVLYRNPRERPWAIILWGTSCIAAILFSGAFILILRIS